MVMWEFSGRERRKYVRLSTELNVDFRLDWEGNEIPLHKGMTRDLSLEGICLATDAFPREKWEEIVQKKTLLHLYIYFPPEGDKENEVKVDAEAQRVEAESKVVWQRHEKRDGKDLCLLGLHFVGIEKNSHEIIRGYIANNLLAKYRSA